MSNIQMSELSGKVSKQQQHVIPTVLDRSSGICVHEEACLGLVLFWGGLCDTMREKKKTQLLVTVILDSTDPVSHAQ